jgi:hypothetical protein
MLSKIKTYFTTSDYPKCKGDEVKIRNCDVGNDLSKAQFDVLTTDA